MLLNNILSINDPIEHTPLVPGYYQTSFGKKKRRRLSRKGSKTKKTRRAIGYCVKKGRVVKIYKISTKAGRYYYDGKKVTKEKKCFKTKAKAKASIKKKIVKRRRGPRTRQSSFGSWDNTQLTYCNPGTECANASTLGGQYPFYSGNSDWKPYYPVKGSAFGGMFSNMFDKKDTEDKDTTQSHEQFVNEDEDEDEPEPEDRGLQRTQSSRNLPYVNEDTYEAYVSGFRDDLINKCPQYYKQSDFK